MATYSPANATELQAAFAAATGGDTIELGAGVTYNNGKTNKNDGYVLIRSNKTFTGSGLLIKSADQHDRAVINNYAARLNGIKGLHFEDVDFVGTVDEPTSGSKGWPVPTPAVAPAIVIDNAGAVLCADISFDRCLFDYFDTVMNIQAAADDLVVQNCNFRRIGEDGWRALHGGARWVFYRNSFADDRVNGLRFEEDDRHPDWIQWGVNDNDSVQYTDALVAENHFVGSYTKPIYISKGGAPDTGLNAIPAAWGGVRHLRHVVRDNWLYASRMLTIHLEDGKDVEILRNTIIEAPPGVGNVREGPRISLQGRIEDITIQNNLMPDTIRTNGVTYVGTNVLTPNTIAASGHASGAPELIVGTNCGIPTVVSGETRPPQPTDGTSTGDGWFPPGVWDQPSAGRYTRPLVIRDTAPAYAATALFWQWGARSGVMAPGIPATATTGGARNRWWPMDEQGDVLTVGGSGQLAGMTWSYSLGGSLTSLPSSYASDASVSPAAPPPTDLVALSDGQWGEHDLVEVEPGFFTWQFWIAADVAATAASWTVDNGATWNPCFSVGMDGSGRTLWQLMPSEAGGQDNIVGYSVSKTIRVRYLTDAGTSAISVGSKTFTGSAAPTPILTPGDILQIDTSIAVIGGAVAVVAAAHPRPATPDRASYVVTDNGDGTVTVEGPIEVPLGATTVWARTTGPLEQLTDTDGVKTAVLLRGTGKWCYVKGQSADGVMGSSVFVKLPDLP